MTHRQRLSMVLATMLAVLGFATVGASAASAAPTAKAAVPSVTAVPSTPITGTFTDPAAGVGHFVGSFTPTSFSGQTGNLLATGNLTGTLTNSSGATIGTVTRTVSMPVTVAQASCRVLDLTLGPLHLDLLGLVVDLNQVHLTINAVPGPGNLLGNLLCAITHLLDGNPTAGSLAALLNSLLALLGQL